ncbi:MAG TPA: NADH-quinone oxidoreductase subunit C/D [bacterium]
MTESGGSAGGAVPEELRARFGEAALLPGATRDGVPTFWVPPAAAVPILAHLAGGAAPRYPMLYDLFAIDERLRGHRAGEPPADFTVCYHLFSPDLDEDLRLKVALSGEHPELPTATGVWPAADWYEREAWDMFGIRFGGHPNLRRLLSPPHWQGHPLRKEHPARATEMEPLRLTGDREERAEQALQFRPEEWGLRRRSADTELLFLNLGPQHPGTHGLLRVVLELDGEEIVDAVLDIGYHHRGAEKMGERQSWHTFIPYTDRIDYLGGVLNNFPYLLALERLAGIEVPPKAQMIRVMLAELFRIASHLVWYGTFAQDLGALSPVFYTFSDRERVLDVVAAITGGRMHPGWFRIGGVANDLPEGWEGPLDVLLADLPRRLDEYDRLIMGNAIFRARTRGIGAYTRDEALAWGVTGPGLRACGTDWDLRKRRPYSGYDALEFDAVSAEGGDCWARSLVRVGEMRQSLRIVAQCRRLMPAGPVRADHPLAVPPPRERMLHDIETLIQHFLGASWGPVIPPGEAFAAVEAAKGSNGYHLVSDGSTMPYRVRIRTPSFPHLQMLPLICRGLTLPDLMAVLGSIDYVLADVDR